MARTTRSTLDRKEAERKEAEAIRARPLDPLQRYSIPEAAALLRISTAKVFNDLRDGKLRAIRDGARTFVPGSEIARLSALPSEVSS